MAAYHEAQDERLTQAGRIAMADALAPLAQRARGCHAAALHLASDGNDEGMAQGVASLIDALASDLERLAAIDRPEAGEI